MSSSRVGQYHAPHFSKTERCAAVTYMLGLRSQTVTVRTIARELTVSYTIAMKWLQELAEAGLVDREQTRSAGRRTRPPYVYFLTPEGRRFYNLHKDECRANYYRQRRASMEKLLREGYYGKS